MLLPWIVLLLKLQWITTSLEWTDESGKIIFIHILHVITSLMPIYNKLICNGLHKIFMQRTVYYKICLLLLRSLLLHFYENEHKSFQHLTNRSGLIDPPNLDHSLIQDGPEFAIKREKLPKRYQSKTHLFLILSSPCRASWNNYFQISVHLYTSMTQHFSPLVIVTDLCSWRVLSDEDFRTDCTSLCVVVCLYSNQPRTVSSFCSPPPKNRSLLDNANIRGDYYSELLRCAPIVCTSRFSVFCRLLPGEERFRFRKLHMLRPSTVWSRRSWLSGTKIFENLGVLLGHSLLPLNVILHGVVFAEFAVICL